jgi:hypothetical protein
MYKFHNRPNAAPKFPPKEPLASNATRKRIQSSTSLSPERSEAKIPKPQQQSQRNQSGAYTAEDEPRREKIKKVTNTDVAHRVRSLERVTHVLELCSDILNKYPLPPHFQRAPASPLPMVEMRAWGEKDEEKRPPERTVAPTSLPAKSKALPPGEDVWKAPNL